MGLKTREEWLTGAADMLWGRVEKHGKIPDTVHVLCSWPPQSIRKIIGVCHAPSWTEDSSVYITISPMLKEPRHILHTLLHEMVHSIDMKSMKGHGPKFKSICEKVGLINEGKHTNFDEESRSPELELTFTEILQALGEYPHTQLVPPEKKKSTEQGDKKKPYQKCASVDNPVYWVYVKTALFEKFGPPICPTSKKPMEVLKDEDDE